jgi:hypothetical protein
MDPNYAQRSYFSIYIHYNLILSSHFSCSLLYSEFFDKRQEKFQKYEPERFIF